MKTNNRISILPCFTLAVLLCCCLAKTETLLNAQDDEASQIARQLTPVFDEGVIVFAHLNLDKVDLAKFESKLGKVLKQKTTGWLQPLDPLKQSIVDAGGKHVFLIYSMSDFENLPVVAIPVEQEFDASILMPLFGPFARKGYKPQYLEEQRLIVIASPASAKRIKKQSSPTRSDIKQLVLPILNQIASLNYVPTKDHLRVMQEFEPKFSKPFSDFDGELLANGIRSFSVKLNEIQPLNLNVQVNSKDRGSAESLKRALDKAAGSVEGDGPEDRFLKMVAESLEVSGLFSGLSTSIGQSEEAGWLESFMPFFVQAKVEIQQSDEVNNLKMILLGMHNFHDVFRGFPDLGQPQDKSQPGLSWRVHILPFVGQAELYEKFKLDEPWDSEHNQKLIALMPSIYRNGNKKVEQGKTTYVMPRGKGFFASPIPKKGESPKKGFYGRTFRDILDGTSNTIAVLQVTADNAVTWTKPQDWTPTEANLIKSLKEEGRGEFIFASADGAVHRVSWSKITPKKLMAWLTISGAEIVGFE